MHVNGGRAVLFGLWWEVPGFENQVWIIASREADVFIIGIAVVFGLVHLLLMRRMDERVCGGIGDVRHCSSQNKQDDENDDGDFLQDDSPNDGFFFARRFLFIFLSKLFVVFNPNPTLYSVRLFCINGRGYIPTF